ncbi:hypothetical protein BZA77DRAFT_67750 [Pyronema omphalodes]|nr:hypothetical protein BZA77DRAFT_67750 [Pyronema omphalodes]
MTLPPQKPDFTLPPITGANDLLSRLNTFLPQISEANKVLEEEIKQGQASKRNIEHVDETTERFIEMNLGLGVLKEIHGDDSSDSSDEETTNPNPLHPLNPTSSTHPTAATDPISTALNQLRNGHRPMIQEVPDEPVVVIGIGMKRRAPESDSDSDDSSEEGDSEEGDSDSEEEEEDGGKTLEKLGGDVALKKVLIEEL